MIHSITGFNRVSPVRPWVVPGTLSVMEQEQEWYALSDAQWEFDEGKTPILAQLAFNETDLPGEWRVAIIGDDLFEFYPDEGECERVGIPIDDYALAAL